MRIGHRFGIESQDSISKHAFQAALSARAKYLARACLIVEACGSNTNPAAAMLSLSHRLYQAAFALPHEPPVAGSD
jgi:hypothetical protein